MRARDWIHLFLLAALWGASFLFINIAVPEMGPFVLIEARVLLAGGTLLVYAWLRKKELHLWSRWKSFLLLGILNGAIPFTLIALSQMHLTSSLAAILNATTPLFTAIVALFFLPDESITLKKGMGLLFGFIGVATLVGWSPLPLNIEMLLATGSSLLAALFYGIGSVYLSRTLKGTAPLALGTGQHLGAAVALLPFAAITLPVTLPSLPVIAATLVLALFCTAIAHLFYFRLINQIGPTKTASVTFLVPAFGLLWGVLFLDESISTGTLIGSTLIFLSIAFVTDAPFPFPNKKKPVLDSSQNVTHR